ncbi:hypothetical protein BDN71DRAFT_343541 [Pleurotus eryngii]|uniref:Uncharacterized protein n=1 Tax=Pleurotus eryngii TaxID=5323 RepID=A0A9P6D9W8_PLEER|nr:hypothetical protein BDN71DRAFT_343541 [Pleurotus eryngii]
MNPPEPTPPSIKMKSPETAQILLPASPSMATATPARSRRQAQKLDQPTPEQLAKLGIKVRDFAYESTLPPIRAYVPRQIQPSRLPTDLDDIGGPSEQRSQQRIIPPYPRHVRQPAYADLRALNVEASLGLVSSSQQSDYSAPSSSQPPLSYYESQASEPYIRTPTVTPNGSLQWNIEDTSAVPASQLEPNTEPELLSYADLGFRDPDETPEQLQRKASLVPTEVGSNFSSPLSSPPGSLPLIPPSSTTPAAPTSPAAPDAPSQTTPQESTHQPPPSEVLPDTASPRYYLRKRPAPPSPISTTSTRPSSRVRRLPPRSTVTPPHATLRPHPPSATVQSAHAKAKPRSGHNSPRPVAVRRSTKATPVR